LALRAYICLNILYCFPETWDDKSGRNESSDYRLLQCFQYTARTCTLSGRSSDIAARPHRQFYGIQDDQFQRYPHLSANYKGRTVSVDADLTGGFPYGRVTWPAIMNLEKSTGSQHSPQDVTQVRYMLHQKGLPTELVIHILKDAGYKATQRLFVAHDPFHEANQLELRKYLTYCWQLIVRSEVMGTALGMDIDWDLTVKETMIDLFGSPRPSHGVPKKWYKTDYDNWNNYSVQFIDP
jgi:hypothetical protein